MNGSECNKGRGAGASSGPSELGPVHVHHAPGLTDCFGDPLTAWDLGLSATYRVLPNLASLHDHLVVIPTPSYRGLQAHLAFSQFFKAAEIPPSSGLCTCCSLYLEGSFWPCQTG